MTHDDERLILEDRGDGTVKSTCKHSGLPLTRKTDLGWFCAEEDCHCEKEAEETYEMIKDLFSIRN